MENKKQRPLVILGAGPTMKQGLEVAHQKNCEVWGCNYMVNPELNMLFQMHGDSFVKARFVAHYLEHPPKVNVVMQHAWDEIPTSVPFPMAEHINYFGFDRMLRDQQNNARPYHACTMSYMMALAIMMECYNPIHLYGVDFYAELRHESTYERPSVEFYMGFGLAKGLTIDIPKSSRLMTTSDNHRQVYGLEWNPELKAEEVKAMANI